MVCVCAVACSRRPVSFQPPLAQTLVELFARGRQADLAAREFIVYQQRRLTFGDVLQSADCLAAALHTRFRVKKGERWVDHVARRSMRLWLISAGCCLAARGSPPRERLLGNACG